MSSILLKGGTVLTHDGSDHVKSTKADILIKGSKIVKIEPNVSVNGETEVVDCTGKIISPGFVDTHHHMWQTQLKGRHADEMLLEYMITGNYSNPHAVSEADFHRELAVVQLHERRLLLGPAWRLLGSRPCWHHNCSRPCSSQLHPRVM
jgi:cytosine/adenosine deaminase-related metal-dependent hydrolase